LWVFETLGIRKENKVHKALKDAIWFKRNKNEFGLPRKEVYMPLSSNYHNNFKHLKGQIERLKSIPEMMMIRISKNIQTSTSL